MSSPFKYSSAHTNYSSLRSDASSPFKAINPQYQYESPFNAYSKLASPSLPRDTTRYRTNLVQFDIKQYAPLQKLKTNSFALDPYIQKIPNNQPTITPDRNYKYESSELKPHVNENQFMPKIQWSNEPKKVERTNLTELLVEPDQQDSSLIEHLREPFYRNVLESLGAEIGQCSPFRAVARLEDLARFLHLFLQNVDPKNKERTKAPQIQVSEPIQNNEQPKFIPHFDMKRVSEVLDFVHKPHEISPENPQLVFEKYTQQGPQYEESEEEDNGFSNDQSRIVHKNQLSGEIWGYEGEESRDRTHQDQIFPKEQGPPTYEFKTKAQDLNDEIRNLINSHKQIANEVFKQSYNQ